MNIQPHGIKKDSVKESFYLKNLQTPHLDMKYRWGMNADDEFV